MGARDPSVAIANRLAVLASHVEPVGGADHVRDTTHSPYARDGSTGTVSGAYGRAAVRQRRCIRLVRDTLRDAARERPESFVRLEPHNQLEILRQSPCA